ncbi:MAG: hypothetical protein GEU75_16230 [Dehalococcoidia bacterium]|nr:hypothetical protein [Dehalococcoidia bacterium]
MSYATGDVTARAREVLAYQEDASREGRPLSLLFGGGVLAIFCGALIGLLAYRTWMLNDVDPDWAYAGIGCLFVIYSFGLFLFSYGFELYDAEKAVRLTLVLVLLSVAALVVMILVFTVLAKIKAASSLSEAASGSTEKAGPYAQTIGSFFGGRSSQRSLSQTCFW